MIREVFGYIKPQAQKKGNLCGFTASYFIGIDQATVRFLHSWGRGNVCVQRK